MIVEIQKGRDSRGDIHCGGAESAGRVHLRGSESEIWKEKRLNSKRDDTWDVNWLMNCSETYRQNSRQQQWLSQLNNIVNCQSHCCDRPNNLLV